MKKTTTLLIFMVGILLVLSSTLANSASIESPYIGVTATPNPGLQYKTITITITAVGERATVWRPCQLVVFFGDGTPAQNIGTLVQESPAMSQKSITHKYTKAGAYTIEVVPESCKLSRSNVLKTTVQILPAKPGIPGRR